MRPFASLRGKFLALSIGLASALGLAVILLVQTSLGGSLEAELTKKGVFECRHFAQMAETPILTENTLALQMLVKDYKNADEDIEYIVALDADGNVMAHTFEGGFPARLLDVRHAGREGEAGVRRIETDRGPVVDIAAPVMKGSIGTVRIGLSEKSIKEGVSRLTGRIAWTVAGVFLLGAAAAALLATAITRPLEEMKKAVEDFGSGDLGRRVRPFAGGEVGMLATAFNKMAEALERSSEELEYSNEALKQEVSERALAERALRRSEERFRQLMERASDGILLADPEGILLMANRRACELTGYAEDELAGRSLVDIASPEAVKQALDAAGSAAGGHFFGEFACRRKDGSAFIAEVSAGPVGEGAVQFICRDVTERRRIERELKASLEEKETLIKEVHHRVKNNLMVISSLLRLQSRKIEDEGARSLFRESQNRVRTMSLIHEQLYRSDTPTSISLADYIRSLAVQIFRSYEVAASRVKLEVNVPDVRLDIDTMIPCGLIVNELVSNCLKHAFPDGRRGEVDISVRKEGERFVLSIRDDGVGIPEGIDAQNADTLGLQLVSSLAEQLGGSIEVRRNEGTEFRVGFVERHYRFKLP